MAVWEIIFIGIALSMDAFAVGLTDGIVEPNMRPLKAFLIAFSFAFFQFAMPVAGYCFGAAVASFVERVAPYLSFALLLLLGGKMIFDEAKEYAAHRRERTLCNYLAKEKKPLGFGGLLLQSVATSFDAFAVGVTLLAADTGAGLPYHIALCALLIGAVTFSLSVLAVSIGSKTSQKIGGGAETAGGVILIAIGVKILLEGII